jgi:eukaryotic-like serine/threonine-protein kinase
MIGELIDHYRVLELLGRGNMGVVYKALDVNLDRPVAVKVMSAEVRNDPDFVERFRQEARLQGALNQANVALLFDYFIHDGAPVAVMEFIDGESLEQMIKRRGPIPAHECLPLFRQALAGVAAAHRAGIVHRDLKPSNLMVTREGVVKVMDFGIAKRQGVAGATKVSSTSIGSPLYMAPEQILGRAVDCRTDIYSLGLTLYQLLSGRPPFNPRGKAEFVLLNNHVNDLPEPPTVYCADIPQPLVDAVMRALAKDPEARFQSADEFLRALPEVSAPAAPMPAGVAAAAGANAPARPAGPTGTVALGPKAIAGRVGPTGTVALKDAPGCKDVPPVLQEAASSGTMAIEYAPTKPIDPASAIDPAIPIDPADSIDPIDPASIDVSFSAGTVWQQLHPSPPSASAPAAAATPVASGADPTAAGATFPAPLRAAPGLMQRVRRGAPLVLAALVLVMALGALARHTQPDGLAAAPVTQPPSQASVPAVAAATPAAPAPTAADTSTDSASAESPAQAPPTVAAPSTAASADGRADAAAAGTAPPARHDLSGTWRGEYVDAAGKELLRVVNLSIERVGHDGGIEGTLEYQAPTGNGECKLHARGSNWSALARRLQLSPEGCSPHFPRELGVPLDFAGVNPQANTLEDGRIEAPTGALIRVRLKRVSGV